MYRTICCLLSVFIYMFACFSCIVTLRNVYTTTVRTITLIVYSSIHFFVCLWFIWRLYHYGERLQTLTYTRQSWPLNSQVLSVLKIIYLSLK